MSYSNGRGSVMRFNDQQLAPTCYIQTLITGECASRPTAFEHSLRGVAPSANNAYIVRFSHTHSSFLKTRLTLFLQKVPGGICGLNTSNAHIPCGGGTYCSDVYYGVCTSENALNNPKVNLNYINYGSRL